MTWIQANSYRICGPNREIYVQGAEPGSDPSAGVTELQFPVTKA